MTDTQAGTQQSPTLRLGGNYRPEIYGLRAVSILCVVIFHLKLTAFQGGSPALKAELSPDDALARLLSGRLRLHRPSGGAGRWLDRATRFASLGGNPVGMTKRTGGQLGAC